MKSTAGGVKLYFRAYIRKFQMEGNFFLCNIIIYSYYMQILIYGRYDLPEGLNRALAKVTFMSDSADNGKPAKGVDPLAKVSREAMAKNGRRSTEELFQKAEDKGVDPFEVLLDLADGNAVALGLEEGKSVSPELRAMAARECIRYMYPTIKQTEVSGPGGDPINVKHDLVDRLIKALT